MASQTPTLCTAQQAPTFRTVSQTTHTLYGTTSHKHSLRYHKPPTHCTVQQAPNIPYSITNHPHTVRYNKPQTFRRAPKAAKTVCGTTSHPHTVQCKKPPHTAWHNNSPTLYGTRRPHTLYGTRSPHTLYGTTSLPHCTSMTLCRSWSTKTIKIQKGQRTRYTPAHTQQQHDTWSELTNEEVLAYLTSVEQTVKSESGDCYENG